MRYKTWNPGDWASQLPDRYFAEMNDAVEEMISGWFSEAQVENGEKDYVKARHVFGRMEIAQTQILPWILSGIPDLKDKQVLEIGCGTGPSTVPLAMSSKHVHAFDLSQEAIARKRLDLLGIENASLFTREPGWTTAYAQDPSSVAPPVDVVVCYALFEHLLPLERIDLLLGAWKHLPDGGHIVIIETHNRLYPFDWHSTYMPFADQLPDELAFLWNAFSDRPSIPANTIARSREAVSDGVRDQLYRFGRGASFHEFHCALGAENYAVEDVAPPDRSRFMGWNEEDIANLERQLSGVEPAVHPFFARPCLDLILRKTGPARLPWS